MLSIILTLNNLNVIVTQHLENDLIYFNKGLIYVFLGLSEETQRCQKESETKIINVSIGFDTECEQGLPVEIG